MGFLSPSSRYYTFNENGDFKLSKYHSYKNIEIFITAYRYDDFRNIVREDTYYEIEGEEASTSLETYEYKYDNQNNWIEKIHYTDKREIYITERTIEYF